MRDDLKSSEYMVGDWRVVRSKNAPIMVKDDRRNC